MNAGIAIVRRFFWRVEYSAFFRALPFVITGGILLFFIILVKSRTFDEISSHPILLIYTFFVSSFALSRLASSLLYKRVLRTVVVEKSDYEPKVSFCIPCKNEEDAIFDTIDRCFAVLYPSEKVEVIVINDGSTDRTGAEIERAKQKHPNLRVLGWEKNRGKKHAIAAAVAIAKGEIFIQLDSDSYVTAETFRSLISPFGNPQIGAVCAHADPQNADTNVLTKMQAAYYFMSFRILKAGESTFLSVMCCSGACSAYRTSILREVLPTWMHERFMGAPTTWGEDRALTSQVLKRGYQTIYSDEVQAYTICPETFKQFFKQQLRWKKSWIVNSIIVSRFIHRTNPFVAYAYFYPLVITSFLTPIITVISIFYAPLLHGFLPLYYILGIFLMTSLFAVYYRYVRWENKYWPYLFLWIVFNIFCVNFIMFAAAARLRDRGWGTR